MKIRPTRIDLDDPVDLLVLGVTSLALGGGTLLGLWIGVTYLA